MLRRAAVCSLVALCAAVVLAYGGAAPGSGASPGHGVLDIYSSLPLQGASSASVPIVNGIKLALAQAGGKAGQFTVKYVSLDDSTPDQTAGNARRAAGDLQAVYYIGEYGSGASTVSIPILNEAGIPQVSPTSTNGGLTTNDPGSAPGEPGRYYPTGKRTFLRIAARDKVQAAALLTTMKIDRCHRVAVANDKEPYGTGLAALLQAQAARYGVRILSNTAIDPGARRFGSYTQKLKRQHADCFMFSGLGSKGAVKLTKDVAAAIPAMKLYGGDGVCAGVFTNPAKGGIPASAGRRFKCTTLTLRLSAYPGGRAFLAAYKTKYGVTNPDPYAIYGYEAMKLGLDTIANLGARGNDRSAILQALFATKNRHSVLGTYSFDRNGDTTLRTYGLYKIARRDGLPVFVKAIMPR